MSYRFLPSGIIPPIANFILTFVSEIVVYSFWVISMLNYPELFVSYEYNINYNSTPFIRTLTPFGYWIEAIIEGFTDNRRSDERDVLL